MSQSENLNGDEESEEVAQRFRDLCLAVNMDKATMEMAWQAYEETKNNYTLEGDSLQWLVCSLYAACRRNLPSIQTVGGKAMSSICVSLTKLLHEAKFSFISFLSKMDKWIQMNGSNDPLAEHVTDLSRNFEVCTNVFKKFMGVFKFVFLDPDNPKYLQSHKSASGNPSRPHRNRRHRKTNCTPQDIYKFCWTLFIHAKGTHYHEICNDLVGSFQLLLSVINLCFHNALSCHHRTSLFNSQFPGLPEGWNDSEFDPSRCHDSDIIGLLVEQAALGLSKEETDQFMVQTKAANIHNWKKFVQSLLDPDSEVLVGGELGLLLPNNFSSNFNSLNKLYEEYVLTEGDFDERVFLCDNVDTELGTPIKSPPPHMEMAHRSREMTEHLSTNRTVMPRTPLTNREFYERSDSSTNNSLTPVSSAVQSSMKLRKILHSKKDKPSDQLLAIFKECSENPLKPIEERLNQMSATFVEEYVKPYGDVPAAPKGIAEARLVSSKILYYHVLEGTMLQEKKRLNGKSDLSELLKRDDFHSLLFSCCVEIVLHSYQSKRDFPWLVDALGVTPYYFYKVIELVIRAEENLPNLCIKHLNHIEEQILEHQAWKSASPLWQALELVGGVAPQCEEVNHPQHIENNGTAGGTGGQTQSATLAHPRLKAVAQGEVKIKTSRSESGSSIQDRFSSPSPGSAKRRLFTIPSEHGSATTAAGSPQVLSPNQQGMKTIVLPASPSGKSFTLVPKKPLTEAVKPRKAGSLALFYRKVYHMSSVRLRHLCENLVIGGELRSKIWTCFEHSVAKKGFTLMRDRHIDQLLMCAVYVMAKITQHDQSFQEIMRCYRSQPQANSNVYRSVLIQRSKSPEVPLAEAHTPQMGSDSAVSTPTPSSDPPSPTQPQVQGEEREDLIQFYNKVYVPQMRDFVKQFSTSGEASQLEVPISPMPLTRKAMQSPRKVATNVYISPLRAKAHILNPSGYSLEYNFQRSPAKQLRNINSMMQRHCSPHAVANSNNNKRHLAFGESDEGAPDPKRPVSRRLQMVHAQRNGFQ